MIVTVVDGKEYVLLDPHCYCTLDQSDFSFPVYLNNTMRPRESTEDKHIISFNEIYVALNFEILGVPTLLSALGSTDRNASIGD